MLLIRLRMQRDRYGMDRAGQGDNYVESHHRFDCIQTRFLTRKSALSQWRCRTKPRRNSVLSIQGFSCSCLTLYIFAT